MKHIFRKAAVLLFFGMTGQFALNAQNANDAYESFHKNMNRKFDNYASMIERKCSDYIKGIWKKYEAYAPLSVPDDDFEPVEFNDQSAVVDIPVEEKDIPILPDGQEHKEENVVPQLPEPEYKDETPISQSVEFMFYGTRMKVTQPEPLLNLKGTSNNAVAEAWDSLEESSAECTLNDCLSIGQSRNLCDWAYLNLLKSVASSAYPNDADCATLFTAYLLGNSGYDFRLGRSGGRLYLMFQCDEEIYNNRYYVLDGKRYYTILNNDDVRSMEICDEFISPQKTLSLRLAKEQKYDIDKVRHTIQVSDNEVLSVDANSHLLDFYSSYPTFRVGGNDMTRWAMYAHTPLDELTRNTVYPQLQRMIAGKTRVESANILLNFVQTGFIYKTDEEIWGKDRVFFAEETLMNRYCDCDDRSVLFSHLVRDLLDLDVILVNSPGHLFTAVKFPEPVQGSCLRIGEEKFVICEPTCLTGAPVGWSAFEEDVSDLKFIQLEKIDYGQDYTCAVAEKLQYKKSLFPVCRDGKYGYKNTSGEIVVPCIYDKVSDYEQGDKFCYVGTKDGKLTLYHETGTPILSDLLGYIPLEQNIHSEWGARTDCYGFVNIDGHWFCLHFMLAGDYMEDAYVWDEHYEMDDVTYENNIYCAPYKAGESKADKFIILKQKSDGKYGVLDCSEYSNDFPPRVIIPFEYDEIKFVPGDKSKVILYNATTGKREIKELKQ